MFRKSDIRRVANPRRGSDAAIGRLRRRSADAQAPGPARSRPRTRWLRRVESATSARGSRCGATRAAIAQSVSPGATVTVRATRLRRGRAAARGRCAASQHTAPQARRQRTRQDRDAAAGEAQRRDRRDGGRRTQHRHAGPIERRCRPGVCRPSRHRAGDGCRPAAPTAPTAASRAARRRAAGILEGLRELDFGELGGDRHDGLRECLSSNTDSIERLIECVPAGSDKNHPRRRVVRTNV